VRLAGALNVESAAWSFLLTTPSLGVDSARGDVKTHEASVAHRLSTPLHAAPSQNTQRGDVNVTSAQALSEDKFHVGALDSACNRTCCGPVWMDSYLTSTQRMHLLVFNSSLVSSVEEEEERFKFGNCGLVTSAKCWRYQHVFLERLFLSGFQWCL